MSGNELYDLIIVGGGPAGATAALYAARHGLSAVLLDKATFPRDKVCGDALSGKAVAILSELGLLDQVRDLPGAPVQTIVFGSPRHTEVSIPLTRYERRDPLTQQSRPVDGFVIRRQVFDHFLFEQARARAERCVEGFAVRELILEGGQAHGVRGRISGSSDETEYRGRLVLGCDGFNSIVARQAGLYRHESRHMLVALRCYYEKVEGLSNQLELHFLDEVIPGYFWIFPLEDGRANVGIGMVHRSINRRHVDLRQALRQVLDSPAFRHRFASARALEEPVGWSLPAGSKHRRNYADGLLLLGDAAGLVDPFTGEGIGNALYSARAAVETAAAAKKAGDCSARFLKRYDQRLWGALGDELKVSTRLQQLGRWRFLLELVIRRAARSPEISDLISGMIANAVPRKKLTNPLFYLKLLLR